MQLEQRPAGGPPPAVEPTGFFTGVKIVPIVLGVILDIVATYAATIAYWFMVAGKKLPEGDAFSEEAIRAFWMSTEGLITSFVIGSLCTALGGFFAARRAGQLEVKHGALVGFGSILLGLVMQSGAGDEARIPQWFLLVGYLAAIPMGALGGYIAETFKNTGATNTTGRGWPGAGSGASA